MTLITGEPRVGSAALFNYYDFNKPAASAVDVKNLCNLFITEGLTENIRGDIAFFQAIHETGWFQFSGDVSATDNNYAGIGATGGGVKASFPDPQTGVRAQIQHLKAYANSMPLRKQVVDPRFNLITARGLCPHWEWLNGHWAVPGDGYGETIVSMWLNACP